MARLPRLTLPGYPAPRHSAGQQPPGDFWPRPPTTSGCWTCWMKMRQKVRSCHPCLCADGQPLSSAGHAADGRWFAANDAGGGAPLCALLQRQPKAHRHAVGRALQVHGDPDRALPAGLHGLHRPQSRCVPAWWRGHRTTPGPAMRTIIGLHQTNWSRRTPCMGAGQYARLPARLHTPKWCKQASTAVQQQA
jgi:hypothetical protein